MSPGFLDTWQMCLLKKGDPRTCRIKAIEEGADLRKQFPLEFSSHPGLAMIKGDDIHGDGCYILIGESTDEKVMQFTVEKCGSQRFSFTDLEKLAILKTMVSGDESDKISKIHEAFK